MFFYLNMNILKTAKVIFPGIRYGKDKPLFMVLDQAINGDSFALSYQDVINENTKLNDETFLKCYQAAKNEFLNLNLTEYNEIIFIAKSLGTIIAGKLREELNLNKVKFICLTPVEKTLPFLKQTDFIIYGDADHYASEYLKEFLKYRFVNLEVIKGGNHRLLTNNEVLDKKNLERIKMMALTYLDSSDYME